MKKIALILRACSRRDGNRRPARARSRKWTGIEPSGGARNVGRSDCGRDRTSTPSEASTGPDLLTVIANWIPAEDPAAGPMYYTFSTGARYNIKIDRNGDGRAEIVYRFRFKESAPPSRSCVNTVQRYTVTKITRGSSRSHCPERDASEQRRPAFPGHVLRHDGLPLRRRLPCQEAEERRTGLRRAA